MNSRDFKLELKVFNINQKLYLLDIQFLYSKIHANADLTCERKFECKQTCALNFYSKEQKTKEL